MKKPICQALASMLIMVGCIGHAAPVQSTGQSNGQSAGQAAGQPVSDPGDESRSSLNYTHWGCGKLSLELLNAETEAHRLSQYLERRRSGTYRSLGLADNDLTRRAMAAYGEEVDKMVMLNELWQGKCRSK